MRYSPLKIIGQLSLALFKVLRELGNFFLHVTLKLCNLVLFIIFRWHVLKASLTGEGQVFHGYSARLHTRAQGPRGKRLCLYRNFLGKKWVLLILLIQLYKQVKNFIYIYIYIYIYTHTHINRHTQEMVM